jgi:hypothetical protein
LVSSKHQFASSSTFGSLQVKKLLYLAVVLVVLAVAGLAVLYFTIGKVVKAGVETVGPRVTKCQVTVGHIGVSPLGGEVTIEDLAVMNPEGFSENAAFSLGTVRVKLVPKSLFSERIVIEEVLVEAPAIRYEVSLTGGTNVGQIQKNVEEFAAMFAGGEQPEEVKEAKQLQIDDLRITGGQITVAASVRGVGTGVPIKLPEVHMQNIGAGEKKNTYEIVADVLGEVLGSVIGVGKEAATEVLAGLKDLGEAAKGVGDTATDTVKGVAEGVRGFFKK